MLNHIFEANTGVYWKQFDKHVIKFLDYQKLIPDYPRHWMECFVKETNITIDMIESVLREERVVSLEDINILAHQILNCIRGKPYQKMHLSGQVASSPDIVFKKDSPSRQLPVVSTKKSQWNDRHTHHQRELKHQLTRQKHLRQKHFCKQNKFKTRKR